MPTEKDHPIQNPLLAKKCKILKTKNILKKNSKKFQINRESPTLKKLQKKSNKFKA